MSLGDASLAVAVARCGAEADAAATALANLVQKEDYEGGVQRALEMCDDVDELFGCLIFAGELAAKAGRLPRLVGLDLDL